MINRGVRRLVAAVVVVAVCAAVLPGQRYGYAPTSAPSFAPSATGRVTYCLYSIDAQGGPMSCEPEPVSTEPEPVSTHRPRPTKLATAGIDGCVRGAGRPVVDTVTPTYSVTFAGDGGEPVEATFASERLDGGETETDAPTAETDSPTAESYSTTAEPGKALVLDSAETGLEPGASYRWRVSGAVWGGTASTWSEWCEFTVAAGLTDMRAATDPAVVEELGVVPGRRYPVTLTARRWKLAVEVTDGSEEPGTPDEELDEADSELRKRLGRIGAEIRSRLAAGRVEVTLTGDEWAILVAEIAATATSWDQMHEEEPEIGEDGAPYWAIVDSVSSAVGGPRRPSLGYVRRRLGSGHGRD